MQHYDIYIKRPPVSDFIIWNLTYHSFLHPEPLLLAIYFDAKERAYKYIYIRPRIWLTQNVRDVHAVKYLKIDAGIPVVFLAKEYATKYVTVRNALRIDSKLPGLFAYVYWTADSRLMLLTSTLRERAYKYMYSGSSTAWLEALRDVHGVKYLRPRSAIMTDTQIRQTEGLYAASYISGLNRLAPDVRTDKNGVSTWFAYAYFRGSSMLLPAVAVKDVSPQKFITPAGRILLRGQSDILHLEKWNTGKSALSFAGQIDAQGVVDTAALSGKYQLPLDVRIQGLWPLAKWDGETLRDLDAKTLRELYYNGQYSLSAEVFFGGKSALLNAARVDAGMQKKLVILEDVLLSGALRVPVLRKYGVGAERVLFGGAVNASQLIPTSYLSGSGSMATAPSVRSTNAVKQISTDNTLRMVSSLKDGSAKTTAARSSVSIHENARNALLTSYASAAQALRLDGSSGSFAKKTVTPSPSESKLILSGGGESRAEHVKLTHRKVGAAKQAPVRIDLSVANPVCRGYVRGGSAAAVEAQVLGGANGVFLGGSAAIAVQERADKLRAASYLTGGSGVAWGGSVSEQMRRPRKLSDNDGLALSAMDAYTLSALDSIVL